MHLTSILTLVGYLGWAFFGYVVFLFGYTIWKRRRPPSARKWMHWFTGLKNWKENGQGWARFAPVWFAVFCCSMLLYAGSKIKDNVEERTALRIEAHPSERQWYTVSKEKPSGEMLYFCDGFPTEKWVYVGYFAKAAKWEVRPEGCLSIEAKGLGFFYDWKPDGTAKTNREAGYE